jgi:anti-sigma factor RsiW
MLSRYMDGELPASDVTAIEVHLESCSRCREELASFREMSNLLASETQPDPFFLTRFRARRDQLLSKDAPLVVWRKLAVRLLPLAAAALIGAAAALWISTEEPELGELEAQHLGDGFLSTAGEAEPVLQIAFEPFPGGER